MSGQLHSPVALPPGEKPPGIHWIGGWVGPITGLGDLERRKILPLRELKLRPLGGPASLYADCAILAPQGCLTFKAQWLLYVPSALINQNSAIYPQSVFDCFI
jgi:hypothetical protein